MLDPIQKQTAKNRVNMYKVRRRFRPTEEVIRLTEGEKRIIMYLKKLIK